LHLHKTFFFQSFNVDVPAAVVKTLVMMAGEIEYENFVYENGEALYPITGHTMILIFTVLVLCYKSFYNCNL
jgi:hypothetical protein